MDMLRFPRGTRNDFQGSRKDSKSSILGTSSVEMVPSPIYGSHGTKKFETSFARAKVLKVLRWQHQCSGRLRGSLQRVVAGVLLGGVRVWQRRQRVRAAHK